jgi:RHS repeat-associated protein
MIHVPGTFSGNRVSEKLATATKKAAEPPGGGRNRPRITNAPRHRRAASRSGGATSAERDGRPVRRGTMPDDAAGSESTRIHDSCARHLFPAVEVYQRPNGSTTGELARQGYEYDTLGRLIHERRLVPEPEGSPFWVGRTTTRDAQGWVEMVSEWGTTDHGTTYEDFDPFGRPGTVTLADGSVISRSYEGVSSVEETTQVWSYVGTTAQNALTTVRNVNDRHGRLVRTEEIGGVAQGGVTTKYAYDVGGRLADVQLHVAGYNPGFFQQRQFDYDNRGFLLAERVPEKGAAGNGWVYYSDYDAMGNVGRKSDGDVELVSRWDGAGRLRSVEASSGCASDIPVSAYSYVDATGKLGTAVTFNYFDGIEGTCSGSKMLQGDEIFSDGFEDGTTDAWSGSLSSEDSLPVVHTYVYGGRGGRLSSVVTSVGDDDFTQGYAWDELGNLSQLTYPDLAGYTEPAEALGTVTNSYTLGHLTAVPEFASSIKYHSNGDLKAIWRTNGRYDAFWLDQHSMGRPRRINAAVLDTRAVVWSTGEYQYDGSGNVKQVGSNEFVYDGLHRLVHGEVDNGTVSQDYVYDGLGNLVEITETSGVPETRTISVDHTTNRLSGGTTYDSVGNLTSWGDFNYSWRVTGEMRARTGPGINKWFGYDAGGERVMVEDKTTGVQTYTLRNLDGKVLRVFEKDGATWTWTKDYVYRGGLLLASRDATGTLHFTLDHLGTPRYVMDQSGAQVTEHEYFGFGEEATTTGLGEPMKFTGHERDLEGTPDRLDDLDYMHARYYSPVLGRFLSVDPVGGKAGSSQSWNRYAYVENNPLLFLDPDGLEKFLAGGRALDTPLPAIVFYEGRNSGALRHVAFVTSVDSSGNGVGFEGTVTATNNSEFQSLVTNHDSIVDVNATDLGPKNLNAPSVYSNLQTSESTGAVVDTNLYDVYAVSVDTNSSDPTAAVSSFLNQILDGATPYYSNYAMGGIPAADGATDCTSVVNAALLATSTGPMQMMSLEDFSNLLESAQSTGQAVSGGTP